MSAGGCRSPTVAPLPAGSSTSGLGLHVFDYNVSLGDLVQLAVPALDGRPMTNGAPR